MIILTRIALPAQVAAAVVVEANLDHLQVGIDHHHNQGVPGAGVHQQLATEVVQRRLQDHHEQVANLLLTAAGHQQVVK